MAGNLEIKVPITVKEDSGGGSIGVKIAEQIKKSLGSIGIGKSGGGAAGGALGKTGLKMAGILGAILAILNSVFFLIKPVISLLNAVLMLFFAPLFPIVSKIISFFTKGEKSPMAALKNAPQLKIAEDAGVLETTIKSVINSALKIGSFFIAVGEKIGQWIYDAIIVPAADFITKIIYTIGDFISGIIISIGDWIYNTMMKVWDFLKNVGKWVWERIIEPAWSFIKDIGVWIWDIIKTPFQWLADKVRGIVDWFSNLNLGKGGLKSLLGFATGGVVPGAIGQPQLAVVHGGEEVIPYGGSKGSITININNPSVRQSSDIKMIANEVSRVLQRSMSGRIAQ